MQKAISLFFLLVCGSVWAAPVTWTLSDVSFGGVDSFTGSFDYDADSNTYSNIDIFYDNDDPEYSGYTNFHWTAGISIEGEYFYSDSNTAYFYPEWDFPEHYDFLILGFASPLTNSGGTIELASYSGIWNQYIYNGGTVTPVATGLTGSVTANVVPIPAAVWPFGSALAGLGWMRRKATA